MERNAKDREKEKTKRDTQKRDRPKNETSIYILPFTDTVNKIFFFQSRQIGNRTKVFLVSFFRLNFLTLSFISVGSTETKVNRKISSYLTIPRGHFFFKKFDSGPFSRQSKVAHAQIGYHKKYEPGAA
jgi:hypothetical protein